MKSKYVLTLQVEIQPADDNGNPTFYNNGQLRVQETHKFLADDFMEVASVLGKFHDLAQKLPGAEWPECP